MSMLPHAQGEGEKLLSIRTDLGYRRMVKDTMLYPVIWCSQQIGISDQNIKDHVRWNGSYLLNHLPLILEKSIGILPSISHWSWPLSHAYGAMFGLITGANPYCANDNELENRFPKTYNLLNAALGYLACEIVPKVVKNLFIPVLECIMPSVAAQAVGWVGAWVGMSLFESGVLTNQKSSKCKLEQAVLKLSMKIHGLSVENDLNRHENRARSSAAVAPQSHLDNIQHRRSTSANDGKPSQINSFSGASPTNLNNIQSTRSVSSPCCCRG